MSPEMCLALLQCIKFPDLTSDKQRQKTAFAAAGFMTCSSLMLVVNKLAITYFTAASHLLFMQLAFNAVVIVVAGQIGMLSLSDLTVKKSFSYLGVALCFLAALFTNIKILQHTNMETFIVFRSATPIIISLLDYIFLGRDAPSRRSCAALLGLLLGSTAYVKTDSQFSVKGYTWVTCWIFVFSFDQIYIKHVVNEVKLSSWSRSCVTNLFSLVPLSLAMVMSDERKYVRSYKWDLNGILIVGLSCLVGTFMSVSSFHLRSMISATSFTVIGTVCKILSVLMNYFMWDQHASHSGIGALLFCVLSATLYQQAPLRKEAGSITK